MGTDWKRFLRSVACCFVPVMGLVVGIQEYASAQGVGGYLGSFFPVPIVASFEPVTTFEKICGPLLPKCDIGNTFRSEVGTGYGFASINSAQLTGNNLKLDLRSFAALDQAPPNAEIQADLRLWRLGLRATYLYFDNKSNNNLLGKLEWSGARFGLDVDAVHHEWLTFGASVDYYMIDPRFNGAFFTDTTSFVIPGGGTVDRLDKLNRIDLAGQKPLTWGLYLRYMPPAILGMPVHFEAYGNLPLAGSKYSSYGALLSFRPQIYRFDLACKLGLDFSQLRFSQFATPTAGAPGVIPLGSANWELDMKWQTFKLDFAAYF